MRVRYCYNNPVLEYTSESTFIVVDTKLNKDVVRVYRTDQGVHTVYSNGTLGFVPMHNIYWYEGGE
jgi:hypothetical protein